MARTQAELIDLKSDVTDRVMKKVGGSGANGLAVIVGDVSDSMVKKG